MGGNYLLNVGPRPDGTIDTRDIRLLADIGDWYRRVGESFGDSEACSYMLEQTGPDLVKYDQPLLTRRGAALYVHSPIDIQTSGLMLHPLRFEPDRAILLNDGRELQTIVDVTPWRWRERQALRIVDLPVDNFPHEPMVIRLDIPDASFL